MHYLNRFVLILVFLLFCLPSITFSDAPTDSPIVLDPTLGIESSKNVFDAKKQTNIDIDLRTYKGLTKPASPEGFIVQLIGSPAVASLGDYPRTETSYEEAAQEAAQLRAELTSILASIENIIPGISNRITRTYVKVFYGFAFQGTQAEKAIIAQLPFVKEVSPTLEVESFLDVSVPLLEVPSNFWNHTPSLEGDNISIAVIDTGIDYTHSAFESCDAVGPNCRVRGGYDFVNEDDDPYDDMGHGTHVASIAASSHDVMRGVAPHATLYAYKVLDQNGAGSFDNIIAAFELAADPNEDDNFADHMHVVNVSLGAYSNDSEDPLAQAANNLVEAGSVVVVSAGNAGQYGYRTLGSPGTAERVLTVGASTDDSGMAKFSSRGPSLSGVVKPDIVAPGGAAAEGQNICAARSSIGIFGFLPPCGGLGDHVELAGTSMAAPHISGLAALILQSHMLSGDLNQWRPDEVKYLIRDAGVWLGGGQPISRPYDVFLQGHGLPHVSPNQLEHHPLIARLVKILDTDDQVQFQLVFGRHDSTLEEGALTYSFDIASAGPLPYYFQIQDLPQESEWNHHLEGVSDASESGFQTVTLPILSKLSLAEGANLVRLRVQNTANSSVSTDYHSFDVNKIEITKPLQCDVFSRAFSVEGSIELGANNSYTIQYRPIGTQEWSSAGILLPNNGEESVESGLLASVTLPEEAETGFYEFRLAVYSAGDEISHEMFAELRIDRDLKWGAPLNFDELPVGFHNGQPSYPTRHIIPQMIPSQSGDGYEVAFAYFNDSGTSTTVERVNSQGDVLESILGSEDPVALNSFSLLSERDDDTGDTDLFTTHFYVENNELYSSLVKHDENGNIFESFESDAWNIGYESFTAKADLNGDGTPELIILHRGENRLLTITDENLNHLPGWPQTWPINTWTTLETNPTIGNFDSDPELEIAITAPEHIENSEPRSGVKIFNLDGSTLNEHWPQLLSYALFNLPESSAADLNNDGIDELIIGDLEGVRVYDTVTGELLPGWPQLGNGGLLKLTRPMVSDFDGDGELEIGVIFTNALGESNAYIFNANGTLVHPGSWPQPLEYADRSGPLAGDINGDGTPELIHEDTVQATNTCLYSSVHARDILTGNDVEGFPKYINSATFQGKLLADIDQDGSMELITSSDSTYHRSFAGFLDGVERQQSMYVWDLNVPDTTDIFGWYTMRDNLNRTGRYSGLAAPTNMDVQIESVYDNSPVLSWNMPGNGNYGDGFVVQVSRNSSFSNIVFEQEVFQSGTYSPNYTFEYTVRRLPSAKYWFRVGSFANRGSVIHAWSKPLTIKVFEPKISRSPRIETLQ
ncbi:MAG: S8 family serine peptidase [Bdellovibrionales bacterium]|nr:S8 family serine peptidase [Bdellovibrionales bacterium]